MTTRTIMKLSLQEAQAAEAATMRSATSVFTVRSPATVPTSQTKKRKSGQMTAAEDCSTPKKQRRSAKLRVTVPTARPRTGNSSLEDSADGTETDVARPRSPPKPRNSRVVRDDSDDEDGLTSASLSEQTVPTRRTDSTLDFADPDAAPGDATPESEGELLAEAEVTVSALFGAKGQRQPTPLTARLKVYTDPSTSCRREYVTTFHLGDATTDHGIVQVAHVHAWRILKRKDWKGELLHLGLKGLSTEDERFECARLLQTLFKTPSALRRGASNHLDLLNPDADIMHVGIVYIYDDFQRQGLSGPVLRSLRQLLTLPTLLPHYQHFGPILLCPGKFNDNKAKCWADMEDQKVTEDLTAIYARTDDYEMVMHDGVLPKLRYLTTILGRMAEDK